MMHPMNNCREISRWASMAMDRRLSLWQRASLWMHWMMCRSCYRFSRQINMMRQIARLEELGGDDCPGLSDEARGRIRQALGGGGRLPARS